jgi:TRAP-type C4-dicarboxylate transport system substrate-binding protein
MTGSIRVKRLVALTLAALVVTAPGCDIGGSADKAGGSHAPVELRLAVAYEADDADAPVARYFASRVRTLSSGSLRVRVVFDAAGQRIVDPEASVARMVRDGDFELGWIGSRAWDRLGVRSFQALQAPFLVTSYALLDRIATGRIAARMLAALNRNEFVGLALVPDRLRYPFGVRRPLATPADFAGARVRVIPSRATDALMRALGATPVHVSDDDIDAAMADGEIDGTEHSLGGTWPGGRYLTANVAFFARAITLFASDSAYQVLTDDQRSAVRDAAHQTVAHVAADPPPESALVRRHCDYGNVVSASRDELAELERAAQPVYTQLQRDTQTRALIADIRRLKSTTPVPPTRPPADCGSETRAAQGRRISPSILNGTYRWRLTKAGAIATGTRRDDPDIGNISQVTLRDGKWLPEEAGGTGHGYWGSYELFGNRIVFYAPQIASTNTFTFTRHDNGDLDLEPVLPMDRGDRFEFASATWRRIGPPLHAP